MSPREAVPYIRVSTQRQGRSGLGLEAQTETIRALAEARGWTLPSQPFVDVESGSEDQRGGLKAALAEARRFGAPLIVAKLDRLSRDVAFGAALLKEAEDAGVGIVSADMPDADRLMLHIRLAMAEEERRLISRRTKEALAAAKRRGKRLGGRRAGSHTFTNEDRRTAAQRRAETLQRKADRFALRLRPVLAEIEGEGTLPASSLAQALNERGIASPRGGSWKATSVRRLRERLDSLQHQQSAPR
ncbi:recombinase family protein [Pyruvatibacter mobilis]|uniref:recombinase family protein n=1 Tax=Pyruvatibacter mobilis TaxID=1712261 RepID=UPI003BAADD29